MAVVVVDKGQPSCRDHPSFDNDEDFSNFLFQSIRKYVFPIDKDGYANDIIQQFLQSTHAVSLNCFYAAMALHLFKNVQLQKDIRTNISFTLLSNRKDYVNFLNPGESAYSRANKIRKNGEWADELEIALTSETFQRNIIIYQANGYTRRIPENCPYDVTINLSYHNGMHYNLLLDREEGDDDEQKMDVDCGAGESEHHSMEFPASQSEAEVSQPTPEDINIDNDDENSLPADNEVNTTPGTVFLNSKVFARGRYSLNIIILIPKCFKKDTFLESLRSVDERIPILYTFSYTSNIFNCIKDDKEICDEFVIYCAKKSIPLQLAESTIRTWHAELIIPHVIISAARKKFLNLEIRVMFSYSPTSLVPNLLTKFWKTTRERVMNITDMLMMNDSLFCQNCTVSCPYRDVSAHIDLSSFTELNVNPENITCIFGKIQPFDDESRSKIDILNELKLIFHCSSTAPEQKKTDIFNLLDSNITIYYYSYLLLLVDGPTMNDSLSIEDILKDTQIFKSLYAGSTNNEKFRHAHINSTNSPVGKLHTQTSRTFLLRSKKFSVYNDARYDESTVIEILILKLESCRKKRQPRPFLILNQNSETAELMGLKKETKEKIKAFCNKDTPIFTSDNAALQDESTTFTGNYLVSTQLTVPGYIAQDKSYDDVAFMYKNLMRSRLNVSHC